jgi:hypothetical protein
VKNISVKYKKSLSPKGIPGYILSSEARIICTNNIEYILIRSKLIQIRLEYSVLKIKKIKNDNADEIAAPPD